MDRRHKDFRSKLTRMARRARPGFLIGYCLLAALSCVAPREQSAGDCNYYWPDRKVHICLVGVSPTECAFLFREHPEFERDPSCVCNEPGRRLTHSVSGGLSQLSCP